VNLKQESTVNQKITIEEFVARDPRVAHRVGTELAFGVVGNLYYDKSVPDEKVNDLNVVTAILQGWRDGLQPV
jgi:hypothetical protein